MDSPDHSDLAFRIDEMLTLTLMADGTASRPPEAAELLAVVEEARLLEEARSLTTVEHYYLGCVFVHMAWLADREDEAGYKSQALVEFRAAFLEPDPNLPEKLPDGHPRIFPDLDRIKIADNLLELIAGPRPPAAEDGLADQLATFLWNVDNDYKPSMLRYAGKVLYSGDAKSSAGMAFDLIRRSVGEDEWNALPMPGAVILATEALKSLARQAKEDGQQEEADFYKKARSDLQDTGDWQAVISRPMIADLLNRCPQ